MKPDNWPYFTKDRSGYCVLGFNIIHMKSRLGIREAIVSEIIQLYPAVHAT